MLILVLSDINRPGLSGLDMLPKVRAARPGDERPKKKAAELGASRLLTKPIDFDLLREEIDQRLRQAA